MIHLVVSQPLTFLPPPSTLRRISQPLLVLCTNILCQSVFDGWYVGSYNLFYTSLPVIIMGSLDQDVKPTLAIRYPSLYYPGIAKLWFSRKVFSNFAIHGLVTSLIITSFALGKT